MDGWQMDGRLGPGDVDPVARAAGRGESQVKSEEAMGDIPAASANKKLRDDARPVPWRCVCHGRCNEDVQVLPARHSAYGSNARSPTVAAWRGEAWGLEADLISLTTIICTAMSVEHLRHNFEISISTSPPRARPRPPLVRFGPPCLGPDRRSDQTLQHHFGLPLLLFWPSLCILIHLFRTRLRFFMHESTNVSAYVKAITGRRHSAAVAPHILWQPHCHHHQPPR
ncbi:hypothetical protein BKA81DRAFT_23212 [Phyllosticta paracitricarpa]|uniref:Uncharacterized protein n=1 Tax=Phyllosticta citricarpa TaxID=55181 RepID=A0ABR1MEG6_9PEZI